MNDLETRVANIEKAIAGFSLSDRYVLAKLLQIQDGRSIQLGRTKGTMIGTAADQKLGFFGASPVAQHSAISAPSGGTTTDSQARSAIDLIINVLHACGLTA
jgi:hypothetical protein